LLPVISLDQQDRHLLEKLFDKDKRSCLKDVRMSTLVLNLQDLDKRCVENCVEKEGLCILSNV